MTQAYAYIRFSSKGQEQGDSVERQLRLAREYAARHALDLDERSFRDLGISAFKGKNLVEGALGTFMNGIKSGVIPKGSYLLVESLDRVSREAIIAALKTFITIIEHDIVLVTLITETKYTLPEITRNPGYLFQAVGEFMRSNSESETKSKRVKEAWDTKRKDGLVLTSICPSWMELFNGKWRFKHPEVETVREVFRLAANNLGSVRIADALNLKGRATLGGSGAVWSPELVVRLLRNRAVIGELVPKKAKDAAITAGYYPAAIKEDAFNQVQALINARRHTGGPQGGRGYNANLFSGMLYCSCGSKFRFVSSNPTYTYLRCLSAYRKQGCTSAPIAYTNFERWVVPEVLSGAVFAGAHLLPSEVGGDPRAGIRAEIEFKQKEIANLIAVAAKGAAFSGGGGALGRAIDEREREVEVLTKTLLTAVPTPPLAGLIDYKRLKAEWDSTRPKGVKPEDDPYDERMFYMQVGQELAIEHRNAKVRTGDKFIELRSKVEAVLRQLLDRLTVEAQPVPLTKAYRGVSTGNRVIFHAKTGKKYDMVVPIPPVGGWQPPRQLGGVAR